jgi:hypothetical protein
MRHLAADNLLRIRITIVVPPRADLPVNDGGDVVQLDFGWQDVERQVEFAADCVPELEEEAEGQGFAIRGHAAGDVEREMHLGAKDVECFFQRLGSEWFTCSEMRLKSVIGFKSKHLPLRNS